MQDSTLLLFALITGILGLIILYFISGSIEIEEKDLDALEEYDYAKVTGKVTRVRQAGELTIITIEKPEYIDAVVYDEVDIEKGMNVEVYGEIDIYKERKQINAERILVG